MKLNLINLEPSCNTVDNATGKICHGRDIVITGYLFGGDFSGFTKPLMMVVVEQAFVGPNGVGAEVGQIIMEKDRLIAC